MLTHAEISRRFLELDQNPQLLTLTVDGWLAWPVIKERVQLLCLAGPATGNEPRKSVYSLRSLWRVLFGVGQLMQNIVFPRRCDAALLYEERETQLPDGQVVHPHLGRLPFETGPDRLLHYLYVWGARTTARASRGRMSDYGVGAFAALLARATRRAKATRRLSRLLGDEVGSKLPEIDRGQLYLIVADQLARFRIRSRLFGWIFHRSGVRRVIVLDPDGKVAEVAAARRLGLEVVEVQHGMFSAAEPEYSWGPVHRQLKHPLPVPDRVVVFGQLWRDELLKAGYWRDQEIVVARNPVLDAFRRHRRHKRAGMPSRDLIVVLFPSQPHLCEAAVAFWQEVLSAQQERLQGGGAPAFSLRIKVHPLEREKQDAYLNLAAAFPETCAVISAQTDAFAAMVEADIVAGFTSLMMIEALGMELPVINLKLGPKDEGFWEVFQITGKKKTMCECTGPENFLETLTKCMERAGGGNALESASSIHHLDGASVESVLR